MSFVLVSCDHQPIPNVMNRKPGFHQISDTLKRVNKYLSHKESDLIESYINRHHYKMTATGTGLRYFIYKSSNGPKALSGMKAKVNFEISLLNGQTCYSSKIKGPETFLIDQDNFESGIHEGIKFMRKGEKALFILPPHLAHGLIGDMNKIPPLTTVVYDIELIALEN
jgi:FKBP-type peptidyl-prolyl cis-trans isomerase